MGRSVLPRLCVIAVIALLAAGFYKGIAATLPPFLAGHVPLVTFDFRSMSALPAAISYTRGGATAYDFSCANPSVVSPFDGNTPMLPICQQGGGAGLGWGIWGTETFENKWSRDLTQSGTWVASSITPTLNQTGIDGAPNSATLLAATADNASIIQLGAGTNFNREFSADVKRVSGTGPVYMTLGGNNWTRIDAGINSSSWTRVPRGGLYASVKPNNTGFIIGTNGDSIAVDNALRESINSNTSFWEPTPRIINTSTANQQRLSDFGSILLSSIPGLDPDHFTIVAKFVLPAWPQVAGPTLTSQARRTIVQLDDQISLTVAGTPQNALNVNAQVDQLSNNQCDYSTGYSPYCNDVNIDTKVANVTASKARCSLTPANQLTNLIGPVQGVAMTVAIGYDISTGVGIVCDNGYGSVALGETRAPAPGFSSGQLTRLVFGIGPNFASSLGGYLSVVQVYAGRLTGSSLTAAMQRISQGLPGAIGSKSILLDNSGTGYLLLTNSGGLVTCGLC